MNPSRRIFGKQLAGAILHRRARLLDAMPGMLSAGYIVRRKRSVRRETQGMALQPGGGWHRFAGDQPFRVASVSKMITATGFMALAARAEVDLDADIQTYLGAPLRHPAFPAIAITARMLLSHTSSLRNGGDFPVPFNRSLLERLALASSEDEFGGWFAPADKPPGAWFAYSDTNFALLAQIIERVADQRFDRFMREALFEPLGLDIGYNWSAVSQRKRNRAVAACRWSDGAWAPQVDANPPRAPEIALYRGDGDPNSTERDYQLGVNGFAFAPHGGLRLSLEDMDRLAQFYLRGAPLAGAGALERMSDPAWRLDPVSPNGDSESGFYQAYGLGAQTPLGRPGADAYFGAATSDWRGHCGDAYGWITGLWWSARSQTTLVYAINGMPETNRPHGTRSALTAPEETLIDAALAAVAST